MVEREGLILSQGHETKEVLDAKDGNQEIYEYNKKMESMTIDDLDIEIDEIEVKETEIMETDGQGDDEEVKEDLG